MKGRNYFLSVSCVLFFILVFFGTVEGKFWGREQDSVRDWADGHCAYRETCSTYYVFGIAVSHDCKRETIVCID